MVCAAQKGAVMSQDEKPAEGLHAPPAAPDAAGLPARDLIAPGLSSAIALPESDEIPERLYVLAIRLGRALADREG